MELSGVSAYGQGNSMTEKQREEMQNMTEEERQEYMEENGKEMRDDDNDGIPNKDGEDDILDSLFESLFNKLI